MKPASSIRVAAAQFAIGTDLEANLDTCVRYIRQAAEVNPQLIVLPEFCNHLSWYDDQAHCDAVSLSLDSPWLARIADTVRDVGAHVVINVTLRRSEGYCTGTSLLYSPAGELLAQNDKQVLIGHENDFLRRAPKPGPIVDTPLGRLGLYACMDGVIGETPRCLALRGAQILCNSLNSFAPDEGDLHIPVRAAENRVFIVAANKVGPLIPEALMEPVSAATGIALEFLKGAGDSQIVAPDGRVLAIAGHEPEVIWADIEPALALDKHAADGTDIFASRRPSLYAPLAKDPATQPEPQFHGAEELPVATVQLAAVGEAAIAEAAAHVAAAVAAGARLVVLPEWTVFATDLAPEEHVARSQALVAALQAVAGPAVVVCSVIDTADGGPAHVALALGRDGVLLRQPQLHVSARYPGLRLGDGLNTLDLAWGRLAVLAGPDARYPELFRLLAMAGVDTVALPFAATEDWELSTGLVERAAENRLCLVVAAQPGPHGLGFSNRLHRDFTVLTPWSERAFDGVLTRPPVARNKAEPGVSVSRITPAQAANKVVSRGTDLVRGRPWWLLDPMVTPCE